MTNNEKIGAAIVGGVILYLLFKKPKFYVVEKEKQVGGGGFMPIMFPVSTPAPVKTETKPIDKPVEKPVEKPVTFPTCPSGQRWNPATNKCEVIILDQPKSDGTTSKPPVGTPPLEAYDPCKTNGYGGTYDPVSNTCKNTPYCGGGTLQLDSKGNQMGCKVSIPTGGDVVIGGNVGFSGKLPLTLDNLLM